MIRSGDPTSVVDSILDPLVLADREVPGYISSRLMAAYDLGDGLIVQIALNRVANGRLYWNYVLEQNGTVLVEGDSLESTISATYGEVAGSAIDGFVKGGLMSLDYKVVKRPSKGDLVVTKFGDARVTKVERNGLVLHVQTERHGVEVIERSPEGWWSVHTPIAWGAWHQGYFPSVRQGVRAAAEWLKHPENPGRRGQHGTCRLWLIPNDEGKGWRLINCADRQPAIYEMERGFYGPFTPENIDAKLSDHGL